MGCTEKDDIPGGHEADPPWEGAGNHVIEDGQPYGIDGSMEKSGEQPLPPEEYRGLTEDVRSSNGDRLSVISGPGADGLLGVRLLSVLGMDDLASARALIKKHNLDDITEKPRVFGSPLHLVALIGSYELTKTLVEEYSHCAASWINAQDANEQQTALHIASKNGNYEIVCLLLDIDCVDDTIQDYEYRLASDLSPSRQIYLKFKSHREIFVEELKAFVSANIESKEGSNRILQRFADGSKAQRYLKLGWFDINSPLNKTTNQNILHLASKYENNDLIEWALNLGSDANVKDSRGRRAIDFIPKRNSIIRQKLLTTTPLKQKFLSGNLAMGLMIDHADNITEKELPVLKDTLFKWTNYASGFRPRFFVIENGVLSYYKTASDYPNACKGSVNLLTCNVEIDNKDSTRLGVYISGKDKPHFSLQARSQVYAKQWFWAMVQSKMILSGRASSRSEIQPHGTDPAKREPQLSTDPQHLDQVADLDRSMEPGDAIPIHNDYPAMIIDSKRDLQIHRSKLSSHLNTVINIVSLIVERFDAPGDWDDVAAQKYLGDESDSQPKITDVLKNAGNQLSSAANDLISTQLGKEARLYEWCRRKSQYIKICEDRLNKVFEEEKETNPPRAQDVTQGARSRFYPFSRPLRNNTCFNTVLFT